MSGISILMRQRDVKLLHLEKILHRNKGSPPVESNPCCLLRLNSLGLIESPKTYGAQT